MPFTWTPDVALLVKRATPILFLVFFWCWETWRPFFGQPSGRLLHAARNLALALINTVILGLVFAFATVTVIDWAREYSVGVLHIVELPVWAEFTLMLILLDCWTYFWHRVNHVVPVLWRFHRMHHSDRHMDVTTATRFHLGEQLLSAALRLGLVPLLGLDVWHFIAYDTLLLVATQFHHADISIGPWDRALRWLIVTPDMHKVHHSDRRRETDSNYSSVLSIWDRLFGSFRMRHDLKSLTFGVPEFEATHWQRLWGMLRMPFVKATVETPRTSEPA